jgi:pimeloyl-ACP methyl ester carboxylesterase/DNA-binding SARP family transcriptional activator
VATLRIDALGELAVFRDGKLLRLPASKRTRALLAYLALTARPHRRDRLCEVFWEIPDDPRGALRWALSKLRSVVNEEGIDRLVADRERVALESATVDIDIQLLSSELTDPNLSVERLQAIGEQLREPMLAGIDLPDQALFQQWLTAEREDAKRLLAKALGRLACHPDHPPNKAVAWTREWLELEPFDTDAATRLVTQLEQLGETRELERLSRDLAMRFHNAVIQWSAAKRADTPPLAEDDGETVQVRKLLARQKIQFCTAVDGVRIAYASVGQGAPIIKAANWLSHLELDWDAPIWSPLFRELARDHYFVRYDERGNGLSDWDVSELSQEAFVADLETVVEATELKRFALLGISQGAAVSIEYAVNHPERVSHLILFGGYAAGWRIGAAPATIDEREAVMTLTATGWGQDNPAYRQIFSSTFMPSATAEELGWFNEFQRRTTSPENAVRFLSAFGDIDVRDRLAQVSVPTLVIHSLGDRRIPVTTGRDIAAAIPNAEFLGLESDGHLLLGREPASQTFVDAVRNFVERT